jgi:GT2 family glycosyltransferase
MKVLPVSAIVPTRDRVVPLTRTFGSLATQESFPAEVIVIDGSTNRDSQEVVRHLTRKWSSHCSVKWEAASRLGAAPQRNQGTMHATQQFIWFFDDDILFEPNCVNRLWKAIKENPQLGGVSAMIINQRYQTPGLLSRVMFRLMHGRNETTFAGKVIGPAINLLPEDRDDLPEVVGVDWLNTTCTMYRREALPNPPFEPFFTGYSFGEDLAPSLRVGQKWKLANVRTARISHDSQPGTHKADLSAVSQMELVNRYYIMTEILGRKRRLDLFRLCVWEAFQSLSTLTPLEPSQAMAKLRGQIRGMNGIRKKRDDE